MHCNNVVVALVDDNKRPFREHEAQKLGSSPAHRAKGLSTGRSCRVLMPFETEFKILVKNQNKCRVKLEITIDGALVSGGGLILDAHMSEYVERSVDVSQKFKFVPANHEDVADPTSEENGNIVVKVWKEIDPGYNTVYAGYSKSRDWMPCDGPTWDTHPVVYGGSFGDSGVADKMVFASSCCDLAGSTIGTTGSKGPSGLEGLTKGLAPEVDVRTQDQSILRGMTPQGEAGAVIDGGDSDQTFGTTFWNGNDGAATKFIFFVRGVDRAVGLQEQKELAELARLKAKYEA